MTGTDAIDVEAHETTPTALLPVLVEQSAIVRPAAKLSELQDASRAYHELYAALLDDSDFQSIGSKRFVKKSGWRKLALAFNVSFSIADKDYERDANGRIIRAEVTARASAPNGRFAENLGACDVFERCCVPGYCTKKHTHCQADCPGFNHFSNASHDLPATAETRAKNRAASDLFGMGEVSAEEMNTFRQTEEPAEAAESTFNPVELMRPHWRELTPEQREVMVHWQVGRYPNTAKMNQEQLAAALVQIGRILANTPQSEPAPAVEAPGSPYEYEEAL